MHFLSWQSKLPGNGKQVRRWGRAVKAVGTIAMVHTELKRLSLLLRLAPACYMQHALRPWAWQAPFNHARHKKADTNSHEQMASTDGWQNLANQRYLGVA